MKRDEFLNEARIFKYTNLDNEIISLNLEKDMLGFTVCQVPIIYHVSNKNRIVLNYSDGSDKYIEGSLLDTISSESVFNRDNSIQKIDVFINFER